MTLLGMSGCLSPGTCWSCITDFESGPLAEVPHEGFISGEDVQHEVFAKEHVSLHGCVCTCVCAHTNFSGQN